MTQYLASIPFPPRNVWDLGPIPLRAYAAASSSQLWSATRTAWEATQT